MAHDPFDLDMGMFDLYEDRPRKKAKRRSKYDDDTLTMRDAFGMTMGAIAFGTAAHVGLSVMDRIGRR